MESRRDLIFLGIGVSGEIVFGVNFPRLLEPKKKYDPGNVFNKGPKLLL
jgi:hypothetical protein